MVNFVHYYIKQIIWLTLLVKVYSSHLMLSRANDVPYPLAKSPFLFGCGCVPENFSVNLKLETAFTLCICIRPKAEFPWHVTDVWPNADLVLEYEVCSLSSTTFSSFKCTHLLIVRFGELAQRFISCAVRVTWWRNGGDRLSGIIITPHHVCVSLLLQGISSRSHQHNATLH